jgi:hypothetical protein
MSIKQPNIQFTHVEKKHKEEWNISFTQGFISISNVYNITTIKVDFPEEDHWTYEEIEKTESEDSVERGGLIKNSHFILIVDVKEYVSEENEGYLYLESKTITIQLPIPYKLALSLIKFMSGSMDLVG